MLAAAGASVWPNQDHGYCRGMWTTDDLLRFAQDGYLVAGGAVDRATVDRAQARVEALLTAGPPPTGYTGRFFSFLATAAEPDLTALLTTSPALPLARALTSPRPIAVPSQLQVAWTVPPYPQQPSHGHLDGFWNPEPTGRPATFTLLVGFPLSDQTRPETCSLVVWPGSHRASATLLREHGHQRLLADDGHPQIPHDNPTPVHAAPGDVIFSSYLLSHETGPHQAPHVRSTVYFRLTVDGHLTHWQAAITDELSEFDAVRAAVATA